jgi:hypothetical protein
VNGVAFTASIENDPEQTSDPLIGLQIARHTR